MRLRSMAQEIINQTCDEVSELLRIQEYLDEGSPEYEAISKLIEKL